METCACNYALFAVVAGYSGSLSGEKRTKKALPGVLAFLAGATSGPGGSFALVIPYTRGIILIIMGFYFLLTL